MASHRKELKLGMNQRDLVNFSVKAQDQILRAAAEGIHGGSSNMNGISPGNYKTTDDLGQQMQQFPGVSKMLNSLNIIGGTQNTTNASQEEQSRYQTGGNQVNRSMGGNDGGDLLMLPSIKTGRKQQASPFKGSNMNAFFDIPMMLATQKIMRQTVRAAANEKRADANNNQSVKQSPHETAREQKPDFRASQSADRNTSVKMNPKVLETWINETLQDAEHLDIPGVILKPEHKNPISRYGIDRLALTNAGIPNELVDRIFRALFVYSVGFYELVKKCLQHTEKKYSIITAIWKVFSILLEYCCKTDYRMLISEISKEHKDEIDRLEKEFQTKFGEQAANERILKQNMEILQKYTEELEKEKNSERQMRLKLEEEYMQNTKNHEEEVQLRLKFESKLNNMHSVHRDLETKYKRALSELAGLQTINEQLYNKNNQQADEITSLKTLKAENESKISYNDEKIAGLQREIGIKVKQVTDLEGKFTNAQDELDLTKYKLQEFQKDLTEHKLKIDVFESQVIGLKNEKQHLILELKETKDLQKVYEKKCGTLITEVNRINLEFQESKREIIGFGEIQKEREERIDKLKTELREIKIKFEDLDLRNGTLNIQYDKVKEQYDVSKRDLDDAIDKLHITNKVRHETELKLSEEQERARSLQDVIRDKDEQLHKRAQEIEDMDRRVIELERTCENLEIKKASLERQFEITKKQLGEKITNLNDVLTSEKETREMWIERYEKEQKEHTQTNAGLLHAKSQLKDQILATKNVEIKLQTTQKANEVLSDQNSRLQDSLNEALAKQENLERDVNTQKEIMKQMEANRKEYIQKLKGELLTVESRFTQRVDHVEMVSQDYLSRAAQNLLDVDVQRLKYEAAQEELDKTKLERDEKTSSLKDLKNKLTEIEMQNEDYLSKITLHLGDDIKNLEKQIDELRELKEVQQETIEGMKAQVESKLKIQNELEELQKEHKLMKTELLTVKKEKEKMQTAFTQKEQQIEEQKQEHERQSKMLQEQIVQSQMNNRGMSQGDIRKSGTASEKSAGLQKTMSMGMASNKPPGVEASTLTEILMADVGKVQYIDRSSPQMNQGYQQQPQYQGDSQRSVPFGQQNNGQQYQQQNFSNFDHIPAQNQQYSDAQHPSNAVYDQQQQYQQQYNNPQLEIKIGEDGMQTIMMQQSPFNQTQAVTQYNKNGELLTMGDTQSMPGRASPLNNTLGGMSSMLQSPMGGTTMLTLQSPHHSQQQQYQQQPGYSSMQQQQNIPNQHSVIHEQQAEYEDDRRSPMLYHPQQIDQRSQNGSASQHSNNNMRQQSLQMSSHSQVMNNSNGNTPGMQRMSSNRVQVDFKNMNTVMQGGAPPSQLSQNSVLALGISALNGGISQQQPSLEKKLTSNSLRSHMTPGGANTTNMPNNLQQFPAGASQQSQMQYQQYQNGQSPVPSQQLLNGGFGGASSAMMQPSNNNGNTPYAQSQQQMQYPNSQQQFTSASQQQQYQQQQQFNPSGSQQQQYPPNQQQFSGQSQMQQQQPYSPQQQQYPQQPIYGNQPMMPSDYQQNNQLTQDQLSMMNNSQQNQQNSQHTATRLKVDINSNSYAEQRRGLNSGEGMSVHTPMSQVSGYSQHLAPSNNRFQQQQPGQQMAGMGLTQPTIMGPNSHLQGPNISAHPMSQASAMGAQHPANLTGGSGFPDKKVTGKSSIRTLIKAAATRDK